jgi:hypothetical protein
MATIVILVIAPGIGRSISRLKTKPHWGGRNVWNLQLIGSALEVLNLGFVCQKRVLFRDFWPGAAVLRTISMLNTLNLRTSSSRKLWVSARRCFHMFNRKSCFWIRSLFFDSLFHLKCLLYQHHPIYFSCRLRRWCYRGTWCDWTCRTSGNR